MIGLADIRVTFNRGTPMETRARRGVNPVVPKGEFLTVIGSNGAGKSTCLNVIAGLCRAETGSVTVNGVETTNWPVHHRARQLSPVFQDPRIGTCEDLTVLENSALAHARTRPRGLRFVITRAMREDAAERLAWWGWRSSIGWATRWAGCGRRSAC